MTKTYSRILRMFAVTAVLCSSMMVTMTDINEEREPFEFVVTN